MNYLNSSFFKSQLLIQAFLLALYIIIPLEFKDNFFNAIALFLLILIGIPHGANDLLYRQSKTLKGAALFLALYVGSMALYGGLWYASPIIALIIFLVISIHHFGQSNFESENRFHLPALFWGSWLLIAPISIHFQESTLIFSDMINGSLIIPEDKLLFIILRYTILFLYIAISIYHYKKSWYLIVAQASLIALWYEFSPLLSGFIIIFTLWHSSQSLFYQWKHYSIMEGPKPSLKFFMGNMILFTLIAGLFIFSISLFIPLDISVLFILLSIVTLPHVVVMDGIYKQ